MINYEWNLDLFKPKTMFDQDSKFNEIKILILIQSNKDIVVSNNSSDEGEEAKSHPCSTLKRLMQIIL